MGNFNDYKSGSSKRKINRIEALIESEKSYMKLLKQYENEIRNIEDMMQDIRAERNCFYTEKLPDIRKAMEMDEVSPEIRARWLEELQANMEKSFEISEELIKHYVTKNLSEFKEELQKEVKVV